MFTWSIIAVADSSHLVEIQGYHDKVEVKFKVD